MAYLVRKGKEKHLLRVVFPDRADDSEDEDDDEDGSSDLKTFHLIVGTLTGQALTHYTNWVQGFGYDERSTARLWQYLVDKYRGQPHEVNDNLVSKLLSKEPMRTKNYVSFARGVLITYHQLIANGGDLAEDIVLRYTLRRL